MPDMKDLEAIASGFGYTIDEVSASKNGFFSTITGGKLQNIVAIMRATDDVCNVGFVVGLLDSVPERARYALATGLLESNFEHPLARISIIRTDIGKPGDADIVGAIVCETTFFWERITRERYDARMGGIYALGFNASQLLAARGALANTNPFWDKLKGASSPIIREEPHRPR